MIEIITASPVLFALALFCAFVVIGICYEILESILYILGLDTWINDEKIEVEEVQRWQKH